MFELIRKHASSVIVFTVAAFIGTIFLVWGHGGRQERRENIIARVYEREITHPEYQEEYTRIHKHYRNLYKDRWTSDLAEQLNIKKIALDTLITKYVLLHEAEVNNIVVGDSEVMAYIRSLPIFQRDGAFDSDLFNYRLSTMRFTPDKFKEDIKRSIIIDRLKETVVGGIKVSENEIREKYAKYHEQIKLDYILVLKNKFITEEKIEDSIIENYYKEHIDEFQRPEQRRAEYLYIDFDRMQRDISINDNEIDKFYQRNQEKFTSSKQVRASHILIKTSPVDTKEENEKKRKKIEEILDRVKADEDFHELASENSECPSAAKGGDLDYFERGKMDPSFEKAAFSLGIGEVSDIVESRFGYHIIKVEDIRPERLKPIEEVRTQIELELGKSMAIDAALLKAEDTLRQIYKKKVFKELSDGDKIIYGQTEYFSKGDKIPDIGRMPDIETAVFNLAEGKFSSYIKTPKGYYILKLMNINLKEPYKLDEVRGKIVLHFKQENSEKKAKELIDKIYARIAANEKLEDLVIEYDLKIIASDLILRGGYIPGLGKADVFGESLFSLPIGSYTEVVEFDSGYCIAQVKERIGIDEEEFKKHYESLAQDLLKQKRQQLFEAYTERIKSPENIEIISQNLAN